MLTWFNGTRWYFDSYYTGLGGNGGMGWIPGWLTDKAQFLKPMNGTELIMLMASAGFGSGSSTFYGYYGHLVCFVGTGVYDAAQRTAQTGLYGGYGGAKGYVNGSAYAPGISGAGGVGYGAGGGGVGYGNNSASTANGVGGSSGAIIAMNLILTAEQSTATHTVTVGVGGNGYFVSANWQSAGGGTRGAVAVFW